MAGQSSGPSFHKQIQRAELIQALTDAMVDGAIGTTMKSEFGTQDFTEPDVLARAFDNMARADDALEWRHFRSIVALPAAIRHYRNLT